LPKEKEDIKLIWKDAIKAKNIDTMSVASTEISEDMMVGKKFTFEEEEVFHIDPK
jgi:hypothetical protein